MTDYGTPPRQGTEEVHGDSPEAAGEVESVDEATLADDETTDEAQAEPEASES